MRQGHFLRGKWIVLVAGLTASCSINPQPEPPGDTPQANRGNGGTYGAEFGGAYNSSSNALGGAVGAGGRENSGDGTSMAAATGGRTTATDSSDSGPDEPDASDASPPRN